MKMMHGALAAAWENRSRTRAAPTPTNISTNSEPEMLKKGTPASPATALASSVLPVPGRADQEDAARDAAAEVLEAPRGLQEVHDLLQLLLGLVDARHVVERDPLGARVRHELGLALPDAEHTRAAGAHAHHEEVPQREHDGQGQDPGQDVAQEGALGLAGELHALVRELLHEVRVIHAHGVERRRLPGGSRHDSLDVRG